MMYVTGKSRNLANLEKACGQSKTRIVHDTYYTWEKCHISAFVLAKLG